MSWPTPIPSPSSSPSSAFPTFQTHPHHQQQNSIVGGVGGGGWPQSQQQQQRDQRSAIDSNFADRGDLSVYEHFFVDSTLKQTPHAHNSDHHPHHNEINMNGNNNQNNRIQQTSNAWNPTVTAPTSTAIAKNTNTNHLLFEHRITPDIADW